MSTLAPTKIKPAERAAVLSSLRAGVVPRVGQHLIQVGRHKELAAAARDIETIAGGGSTVRFIIGDYGSGKTFFLNRVRTLAFEERLVTVHADLTPEIRLRGSDGQARRLYSALMGSISTRVRPDGKAMTAIVELFVTEVFKESERRGVSAGSLIHDRLHELEELTNGYQFARVIELYWKAHETMDEHLKGCAVRWLRAGYDTRTDASRDLGIKAIIDDENIHDHLKLTALFVRQAGFKGMLVCLDEMVNIFKLAAKQARDSNYDTILNIVNDSLPGNGAGLGFYFGGTPEFLTDNRRGSFSNPALARRLEENPFGADLSGLVIRLANLTSDDLFQLLVNIRHVHAGGDPKAYLVPDEALSRFMEVAQQRLGASYFGTPSSSVRDFTGLLGVLEGNPNIDWRTALNALPLVSDIEPDFWPQETLAATAGMATAGAH